MEITIRGIRRRIAFISDTEFLTSKDILYIKSLSLVNQKYGPRVWEKTGNNHQFSLELV